jgi:hypothetical protein
MPIHPQRVATSLYCECIKPIQFLKLYITLHLQPRVGSLVFRFNNLRVFNRLTLGSTLLLKVGKSCLMFES